MLLCASVSVKHATFVFILGVLARPLLELLKHPACSVLQLAIVHLIADSMEPVIDT